MMRVYDLLRDELRQKIEEQQAEIERLKYELERVMVERDLAEVARLKREAAAPPLAWTRERPTEPGQYWVRRGGPESYPIILRLVRPWGQDELRPAAGGPVPDGWMEYAGPIPRPTEPEEKSPDCP